MLQEDFNLEELVDRVKIPPDRLTHLQVRALVLAIVERARRQYQPQYGGWRSFVYREVTQEVKKYNGHLEPEDRWKGRKDIYD